MNRLKELREEAKSVEKLESVYVEFLGNITYISDIDLEDLKGFSNRLYEIAIAEKTRRAHVVDTLSSMIEEKKQKNKGEAVS